MADARDQVAALTHDLRSPLAVIELYSGLLAKRGTGLEDAKHAEYVARIRSAVDDMRTTLDAASSAG